MHRRTVLAGLTALPVFTQAGRAQAAVERPFNLRIVMSGHSLTDPIPEPLSAIVRAIAGAQATGMAIDSSTTPGSPADFRWSHPASPVDARHAIGNYDLLVLTERVPVRSTLEYHAADKMALTWFEHAWKNGNGGQGAETVYYATWISLASGPGNTDPYDMEDERLIPFRERLDLEMTAWQEIADYVNANRPSDSPQMRVIPGPRIMAALFDAIAAGRAPGLASMDELFSDGIHLSDIGAYPIALAHFAVIYGRDPRGVPALRGEGWPSAEQQEWMKSLVWEVLSDYPDSGLA